MADQLARRNTLLKPEPIKISELQVHAEIRGWLFAEEVQVRTAKNGRPFRQLRLRDQRGNEIKARQFDLPAVETLAPQAGKVVLIEGLIEEYQKTTPRDQLIINILFNMRTLLLHDTPYLHSTQI